MYRVNVVRFENYKTLANEVLEELTFESISEFVAKCYDGRMNEEFNRKYGAKKWNYCDYKETPYGCFNLV